MAPIQPPAWLWPIWIWEPSKKALGSFRPTRIGHAPPAPSGPLRPSQVDSIRFSVCEPKNASTQPGSRLLAGPLPQLSSGPEKTWLLAASWQLRLVMLGSRREKVDPDWVV